jgi:hypothetical protein
MEHDPGLRMLAVAWGLVMGLLMFPTATAFAWAQKNRYRWPLTIITLGYLGSMLVMLLGFRR